MGDRDDDRCQHWIDCMALTSREHYALAFVTECRQEEFEDWLRAMWQRAQDEAREP